MASITVFTVGQLMIDIAEGVYWLDIGNFSSTLGLTSTSLFHLSFTPQAVNFDCLWIGGLVTAFKAYRDNNNISEEYDDGDTRD